MTASTTGGASGMAPFDPAILKGSRTVALVAGVISLGIGIAVMAWPEHAVKALAIIVGLGLLFSGVATTLDALFTHRAGSYWGLMLAHGILNILVGLAAVFYPDVTVAIVAILVGINLVIGGGIQIFLSRQVPPELETRSRYLWRGILWVVFGLVVIAIEGQAAVVLAFVVGAFFALSGLLLLFLGFQIGKIDADGPSGA